MRSSIQSWYLINADNQILGRLSTKIANLLIGKHKEEYAPNKDVGDYVIVINAEKIAVTGKKFTNKMYYWHTGYIGNLKTISFRELVKKNPKLIIYHSVKGMLPKNKLGNKLINKLKIYVGNSHKHIAQKPKFIQL